MSDPRIDKYREAAAAMKQGIYKLDLPVGQDDELGRLGKTLLELGDVLERKYRGMQALARVAEQVNAGLLLDDVLDQIFDSFHELIPYERIGLALLEDEGRLVRSRWARSSYAAALKIAPGYSAALQGSSLMRVIQSGEPRILNNLEDYLWGHPESESTRLILEEGILSSLTCPLTAMGKPIGFLFFSSTKPETYKDVHVELFMRIAGHLAVIVEKSRLYQQLLELHQFRSKFLGIVAHDMRNPISIVMGYLDLFREGALGEMDAVQRSYIERMEGACRSLQALIDDLLDISAVEAGRLELDLRTIDPMPLLRESFESNRVLAEAKGIRFVLKLPSDLPRVRADARRLNQVLGNLFVNAIKFSFSGTTICLHAHASEQHVIVSVQDQGQGIPAEELRGLFGDYQRATPRPTAGEKSMGLGLAIVRRIVEAHQGRVWVESEVGRGSTFSFALPAVEEP